MMHYFADLDGTYLGGWDQGGPVGKIKVPYPPEDARQVWNGFKWGAIPTTPIDRKLKGVEFQGVMCSATKEDMWGLSSIAPWIQAGNTTKFEFDNGNVLEITPENYRSFYEVWTSFRASFFNKV